MADRLILVAEPEVAERLRSEGGMPSGLLALAQGELPNLREPDHEGRVVWCDPAHLLPHAGENDMRREDVYASILQQTLCHLVVLDGSTPTDGAGTSTPGGFLSWHNAFQAGARAAIQRSRRDYRHVLILVCTERQTKAELDHILETMRGNEEQPSVARCFLMLRSLEMGPSELFHAPYVWPQAVSRLLVRLLTEVDTIAPGTEMPITLWRGFELSPRIDRQQLHSEAHFYLDRACKLIQQEAADRAMAEWLETGFEPGSRSVEMQPLTLSPAGEDTVDWHTYEPDKALAQVLEPTRAHGELRRAGAAFRQSVNQRAVEQAERIVLQVKLAWQQVAKHPSNVGYLANSGQVVEGVETHFDGIRSSWQSIRACDEERTELGQEATEVASVFADAQLAFVPRNIRFRIAGIVTLGVAWLFFFFASNLVNDRLFGVGVAAAAFVGAAIAVLWSLRSESRRGERAKGEYRRLIEGIDGTVHKRHAQCQRSVEQASQLWVMLRQSAAANRTVRLARRVQLILAKELEPSAMDEGLMAEGADEALAPLDDEPSDEVYAERQRLGFQLATVLRTRRTISLGRVDGERMDSVIAIHAHELFQLWGQLCDRHDGHHTGNLPALVFVRTLRRFFGRLQRALIAEIHHHALAELNEEDMRQLASQLTTQVDRNYEHYMSAPLHGMSHEGVRPNRVVLANPEMKRLKSALPGVCEFPARLKDASVVGYAVQYLDVILVDGPDGPEARPL